MKNEKLKMLGALATGALLIGSANANTNDIFQVTDLGSGAELRSELLTINDLPAAIQANGELELKCGEGKCGEGKCGEKSEASSEEAEATAPAAETEAETEAASESKEGEHKCGEGKCGEGKCGSK